MIRCLFLLSSLFLTTCHARILHHCIYIIYVQHHCRIHIILYIRHTNSMVHVLALRPISAHTLSLPPSCPLFFPLTPSSFLTDLRTHLHGTSDAVDFCAFPPAVGALPLVRQATCRDLFASTFMCHSMERETIVWPSQASANCNVL